MTTTPTPPLALPALPEPGYTFSEPVQFTATQMDAHATAAILSDRAGRGDAIPRGWTFNDARPCEALEGAWSIGHDNGEFFSPIVTVDTGLYYQPEQAEPLARAILTRLSAVPAPQAVAPGWVSVEDRLPEVGASVWVALWAWNDPKRGQRVYGRADYDGNQWSNPQDDDGPCLWYPPTHWMTLVAAPTGEAS